MHIALGTEEPECILVLAWHGEWKPTGDLNEVPYKDMQNWPTQIERHIQVKCEEVERKMHSCQNKGNMDTKFHTHWNTFMDMGNNLEIIWNGLSSRKSVAKHQILMKSNDAWPVPWTPYKEVPATHDFEKTKINKMFDMAIIELIGTKWTTLFLLAPHLIGSLQGDYEI